MEKKRYLFYLLILLFAVSLSMAEGEKAEELTGSARFETNGGEKNYTLMTDGDLKTYFPLKEKKGILTISCEKPIHGVYIMVFDKYGRGFGYDLQIPEGDGWKTVEQGGEYLVQWHEMEEPTTEIRIAATAKERMRIAEIRLFGEGETPAEIQKWETLDKADLMLLTAHPDDEILWFAGLMPVYGGERKLKLQVTVMVPTGGQRKLELLSAIWHCGVKYYPEMLGFVDKNRKNPDDQYKAWRGKDRVVSFEVGVTYHLGRATFQRVPETEAIKILYQSQIEALSAQLADEQRENANLRSDLMYARNLADRTAQTATFQQGMNAEVDALYNRLKNCPVNTVPVYGNQPVFTCAGPSFGNNGCGCGGVA